ncbi:MAG TPA: phosphatase PAP2 family protein [Thermoanaerobaculia bacterium]|jgi:undecaprenyl-diphosphatase
MLFLLAYVALFLALWGILTAAVPLLQRVLTATANRTARFRYRDYVPVGILLVAGLGGTVFLADEFLDLAELVHESSPRLREIDSGAHEWARTYRSPGATAFFTTWTVIGTPWFLAIIAAVVGVVLATRRRWRWLLYLAFTSGVGALIVVQLKVYFARARPDLAVALRKAHGYSFPSGHAMGSTILFLALSYLAFRAVYRWKWKAASIALAWTSIAAISFSRVYLGVHWISDIGAGIAGGTLWVVVTTVAYETFRRIRAIRALRRRRTE